MSLTFLRTFLRILLVGLLGLAMTGCATTASNDPLEPMNRGIYSFNKAVDKAVIKPAAQGYRAVVPSPVRSGVRNFFSNLHDVVVLANDLLQFKLERSAADFSRIFLNTTLGVLGVFDVATHIGIEKNREDFGQTLGYWGIGDGPYLVLPFLGPSNLRDTVGIVADGQIDPVLQVEDVPTRNGLVAVNIVDKREGLLDSEKVLDTASIDEYSMLRESYLQHRKNLIYDGNPPRPKYEDME